jgi:hypothetical protein
MNEYKAAELLDIAVTTLRRYRWLQAKTKRLVGPRHYKLGRCVKYSLDDLLAFIAAHRVELD